MQTRYLCPIPRRSIHRKTLRLPHPFEAAKANAAAFRQWRSWLRGADLNRRPLGYHPLLLATLVGQLTDSQVQDQVELLAPIGPAIPVVIDAASHEIVKRLPQASPFCPNIAVSPENDEVWITLKDAGKVQVYSAKPPFEQKALLETGPITNHVNFANNRNGKFAYVTIGGLGAVKVFRRGPASELIATIPVGDLPHGIWPSGDGSRVYVALENAVEAAVIDTFTNRVIANVPIGQTSQALVYVPNAVPAGDGTDNLVPLGEAGNTARLRLEAGGTALPDAQGWVAVNSLGLLDLVQLAAEGLTPKSQYQVYLAESAHAPFGKLEPLAVLRTNPDGAGIVQAIGPLKALAGAPGAAASVPSQRFLIVTGLKDSSQVVLRQSRF
jgi:YVTN family beta-propeller protein